MVSTKFLREFTENKSDEITCGHCDRITYETIEPCICVPEPDPRAAGIKWALEKLRNGTWNDWAYWIEKLAKDESIL